MRPSFGPEFTRFFPPIVAALQEMGGAGSTSEVVDRAIDMLGISEAEQEATLDSGGSRVRNQAQWARLYLVKAGLLDSSSRGTWKLTPTAAKIDTSHYDWAATFKLAQKVIADARKEKQDTEEPEDDEVESIAGGDYRSQLIETIRTLPPSGFEKLCQRILREAGFEHVTVTGRSGDGGIDGVGILQVNHFVSFQVLFQCKRYKGSVSTSQIRDFRGAMMGRADKGIILTTGTFTVDAKKESRRDGAPPIELVDGDDLIRLLETLEVGLIPRTTYDIDTSFFEQFA